MTEENLKTYFKLFKDDGLELECLSLYSYLTANIFFKVLPKDFEPHLVLDGSNIEFKVYYVFGRYYAISNEMETFCETDLNVINKAFTRELINENNAYENHIKEVSNLSLQYAKGQFS